LLLVGANVATVFKHRKAFDSEPYRQTVVSEIERLQTGVYIESMERCWAGYKIHVSLD